MFRGEGWQVQEDSGKGGGLLERFRLKNIIIFILVLMNGFLLASVAQRRAAEQDAFHRTAEQLVALFQADGMALDPHAISRDSPPDGVTLSRDVELEEKAASFLLGADPAVTDQGGGIVHYAGAAGEAFFRAGGSFEASGTFEEVDPLDFCRDFCRSFSYEAPQMELDEDGSGVFTAGALFGGLPVFNCTVSFTIEQGVLIAVRGTLLPKSGTAAPGGQPLSAAGALGAFQRMRRENAAVASTVTDTRLCYELQTSGGAMSLAPVWRIVTDTEDYYVNCFTGAVSALGGVRPGEGSA